MSDSGKSERGRKGAQRCAELWKDPEWAGTQRLLLSAGHRYRKVFATRPMRKHRELALPTAPLSVPLPSTQTALLALSSTEDLLAEASRMLTDMGIPADEQDALFADCCKAGGVENEPTSTTHG